jgi:hypothetical protein
LFPPAAKSPSRSRSTAINRSPFRCAPNTGGAGSGFEARLQPNPVYAELQPTGPARPGKSAPSKKRTTASRAPARLAAEPAASNPGGYPWPPPPQ